MSESFPNQHAKKSSGSRRLAMGCGGIVLFAFVAIIVVNILIKDYVINRLEKELASKGLKVEIDKLDYSLIKKEVMVERVTAVHVAADDFDVFGDMNLDRGVIKIFSLGRNGIAGLDLEGARMKMGSVDEIKFIPGVSVEAKGLKVNNPKEFGGGVLLECNEVAFHFKTNGQENDFKKVRIDVQRVNIVRNKKGLWLTDLMGEAQKEVKKIEGSKTAPAIDDLKISIAEISFQDLSAGGPAKVIKVEKLITAKNQQNPRAYGLSVILQLAGIVYEAKKKSGF